MRRAVLALPLLSATAALAEGNPWGIAGELDITHDSNVLRAPTGGAVSDTIFSAGLRGQLDQGIGRERLRVNALLEHNRFQNQRALDNLSHEVTVGLSFEPGNLVFGELNLRNARNLANRTLQDGRVLTQGNLERQTQTTLRLSKGVVSTWTLVGGFDAFQRRESEAAYALSDLSYHSLDLGVRYQSTPELRLTALLRRSQGEYPNLGSGDDYSRNDLELRALWEPTGASQVDTRLVWGNSDHSLSTIRSGTQWSGAVSWTWQATGKTRLLARAARYSDTGARDIGIGSTDIVKNYNDALIRTTVDVGARWRATGKILLEATASRSQRSLSASLQSGTASSTGSDRSHTLQLAVSYQALRNLQLACQAGRESRSISGNVAGRSFPYSSTTFGCSVQAWLR
ncbi:hypothetical protein KAK06_13250 [Ideonella sp. 4Y11]|uniref:TIGR03016 family PEP-CTERM system-associated outer membrane protein n=1 Tax=Ideonella aquatica TaxID=2824119 RepID=A0A940YGR1_9BURK|nr:hypothetical protein [Ideonella aquatica]MBQ0959913.1 hypothetical protein [Ideonella aquatica]